MNLRGKKCKACEGGAPPLNRMQIEKYQTELHKDWKVFDDDKKISRDFKFTNFKEAMAFVYKVADLAEDEGHHPDIHIFYNRVNIELWTHAVKGLSENDFILASKIDAFF